MRNKLQKRSHLKQKLWKVRLAQRCARRVISFCKYYLEQQPDTSSPLYYSLMTAICVVYAKPFTNNNTVGMLSEKYGRYLDTERTRLHKSLIAARNNLYAHHDPNFLKFHVQIETKDAGDKIEYKFCHQFEESHFDPKWIPDILRMCEELNQQLEKSCVELQEQLFGKQHWPVGKHTLNLFDES